MKLIYGILCLFAFPHPMNEPIQYERDLVFSHPDFPLDVSTWENHPDYPLHTHNFSEIVIIAQGTGFNLIGNEEFPLTAGDVFILHGSRPHGYRSTNNLTVINIIYDPVLLANARLDIAELPGYQALFVIEPALHRKGNYQRHMHLDMDHLIRARALTESIEMELHAATAKRRARIYDQRHDAENETPKSVESQPGFRFIAMGYFIVLVGLLSRWYSRKPTVEARKIIDIGRAISHMEAHFDENTDVDILARMAGMSRRNFYRIFQEVTGETPLSYRQHIRIMKAVRMLETTDKNVTETAFECGFEDSNYFSRQFRQVIGMPPSEFKARHRMK